MGRQEDAAQCIQECALITEGVYAPLVEFNLHLVRAELGTVSATTAPGSKRRLRKHSPSDASKGMRMVSIQQPIATSAHSIRHRARHRGVVLPLGDRQAPICAAQLASGTVAVARLKIRDDGEDCGIYLDNEELIVKGKAQRKPLEILKLLTAYPDGVETCRVMDELWPDLEGDAARNALDIALHRLRKILRRDAMRLINGILSLNKDIVWLDTEALDRIGAQRPSSPELSAAREEILELYRGGLLGDQEVRGTLLVARDRLRNKFVGRVSQLAKKLENTHRSEDVTFTVSARHRPRAR